MTYKAQDLSLSFHKPFTRSGILAAIIAGLFTTTTAHATNGYFAHGYSTKEKGLAGAGTALSQDAMAAATNPAGMAFIGERMDIGAAIFSPSPRSYTVSGQVFPPPPAPGSNPALPFGSAINAAPGATVESENDFFLIPHFAYNWELGSDTTVGVSVYGNGGMNTKYEASGTPFGLGTFGAGTAGVNLEQLFTNVSMSKMLNSKHAIGGGVILGYQRFRAQGIDSFGALSLEPTKMSGNVNDAAMGLGFKFGYQGEVSDGVRVGAAYQSKINMGEFDEYKGLFAEHGDFDVPSTWNIGVAVDVADSGVIVADIQRINYSDVAAISNPIQNALGNCIPAGFNPDPTVTTAVGAGCLGGPAGGGFGWKDMTVFKIGYQWDAGDNTFRVGFSHTDQPIPESETLFNILAPAVIENHITGGWTRRMGGNQELNLSAMYAPESTVKGANPIDGGASQIELSMSQWELQAGWAWKF